jgi:peptidoglycan-associated lipoprotein
MKGRVLASTILMAFLAISGCAQKANYSGDIKDEQAEVDVVDITSTSGVSDDKTPGFTSQPDAIDDERKGDGLLKERLIFFDYDKSAIKEHYLHIISAHADFLVRNPSMGIILEGNTDNRGSNEYNLALGQRRADATRDIMLSFCALILLPAFFPFVAALLLSFADLSPLLLYALILLPAFFLRQYRLL